MNSMVRAWLAGQEGTAYHIHRVDIVGMAEAPEQRWGVQSAPRWRFAHRNGKEWCWWMSSVELRDE